MIVMEIVMQIVIQMGVDVVVDVVVIVIVVCLVDCAQSRETKSAATLSSPAMCSTSKLHCCISHFHLSTLGDASLFK